MGIYWAYFYKTYFRLKNGCVVGEFYAMTYVVSECGTHITILKAEMCSAKPVLSRVVNGRVQVRRWHHNF